MGRARLNLALVGLLAMMACGTPDADVNDTNMPPVEPAPTTPAPGPEAGVESLTATLTDTELTLSKDSVPAGAVTILVRNTGTAPHAFQVSGAGELWETDPVAPGTDVSMSLNLPIGEFTLSRSTADGTAAPGAARLRVHP
ncbi:MAG TPA: hypothetical protein VK928_07300 [Longimicrobiales bacterium]|nr:hypothetical protein [Longimicrobiales bacterium]